MADPVLDARGVAIAPGDTVIYGFGVGRSVAMAEGVVLGERTDAPPGAERHLCVGQEDCERHGGFGDHCHGGPASCHDTVALSLTPTGMIRVRVVRRSYSSGEKPVVAINPDRVVVLKPIEDFRGDTAMRLPPSPLPTQDEVRRTELTRNAERYRQTIAEIERTGEAPEHWRNQPPEYVMGRYREWLAEAEAELVQVEERL
ncbi:hypothetical protein [Streptomyces sp. S1]|uniref:hypothetical protein n=1 Tax=Streptomyces sp. S1 TaxID=718288 RepID=UPI003D738BAE